MHQLHIHLLVQVFLFHPVEGFFHRTGVTSSRKKHPTPPSLFSSSPQQPSPTTVINPFTNRRIRLGGPKYNDFLKEGKWVQQDGALQPLDLELLRKYQVQEGENRTNDNNNKNTKISEVTTIDACYSIVPTPILLSSNIPEEATRARKEECILLSEDQRALLQKELLFVHKPSGLHCVPPRDATQPSLVALMQSQYHKKATVKPCHRLDRDTSGIVVFGLTPPAHTAISRQFEERTTSKTYLALVAGHPTKDSGTIDLAIGKRKTSEGFHRWATTTETGGGDTDKVTDILKPREAVTDWKVQERFTVEGSTFARVELKPRTGRGHQLRLHMKALGHPILGDTLHAPDAVAQCAPRLCLHAYRLQVDWQGLRLEATSVAPF